MAELDTSGLRSRFLEWEPMQIESETLALVHPRTHQDAVRAACERGPGFLDPDTKVSTGSWEAATRAAGGVVEATQRVLRGQLSQALCLGRPPGHHALPRRAMGFCLFNSAAVGAKAAITEGLAERVAIVDVDVHHGNGTQDVFYEDPSVLYCSTHQYPFYPGTGALNEVGAGPGQGTTVNVPFPAGTGDDAYRMAVDQVLRPSLDRFAPDLLVVSVGFDAHWRDPLAGVQLSLAGYREVLGSLLDSANRLCGGRAVFVLEGGYDLSVLAQGTAMLSRLLLGDQAGEDALGAAPGEPEPAISTELVAAAARLHRLA